MNKNNGVSNSSNTTNQTTNGTTQQQPQATVHQQLSNDKFVLTVGFEVNYPSAFVNDVHNLGEEDPRDPISGQKIQIIGDYGHAYFYVTKNDVVDNFFSFGPASNIIIDGVKGGMARVGRTDYPITEISQLFRLLITEKQAKKIREETLEFEGKVALQKVYFDPVQNDTCAAFAKKILDSSGVKTPYAKGHVTGTGSGFGNTVAGILNFTNPFMWHKNFVSEYGSGITFIGITGLLADDGYGNLVKTNPPWLLNGGDNDPLLGTTSVNFEHGDVQTSK